MEGILLSSCFGFFSLEREMFPQSSQTPFSISLAARVTWRPLTSHWEIILDPENLLPGTKRYWGSLARKLGKGCAVGGPAAGSMQGKVVRHPYRGAEAATSQQHFAVKK